MKFGINLVALAAILTSLSGCGKNQDSTENDLKGTWQTDCTEGDGAHYIETYVIAEGTLQSTEEYYSDSGCKYLLSVKKYNHKMTVLPGVNSNEKSVDLVLEGQRPIKKFSTFRIDTHSNPHTLTVADEGGNGKSAEARFTAFSKDAPIFKKR